VDATTGQTVRSGDVEHRVADAGSHQQCASTDLAAIGQAYEAVGILAPEADGFGRGKYLGAEPSRLGGGSPTEFSAAKPGREAEVVLDARTGSRLTAR